MRFAVMIKQVPDSTLIEIDENGSLRRDGVPSILDPYSFFALRMAVSMREALGGTITAITMGPQQASDSLMRCFEYGADSGVLLNDISFAGSDTWATAKVLSEFLKKDNDYDIILCGMQATDGNTAQVPAELSVMLGAELFSNVINFDIVNGSINVVQDYDGITRTTEIMTPAVISVSKGSLITEKMPSIQDYLDAREKKIVSYDRDYLGLKPESVGVKGSLTKVISSCTPMPDTKNTVFIDGSDARLAAKALIREVLQ